MIDARQEYAVLVALSMLTQWYVTWEGWRGNSDPVLRQLALSSKLKGLVYHDRALIRPHSIITRRKPRGRPIA